LRLDIAARNQTLTITAPHPAAPITADRRALHQILLNLLGNAIKFTPEGGRIELAGQVMDQHCVIAVRDSGPGIPGDVLTRLGQPFERGGDRLQNQREGAGLGLALSRALAELHGGSLDIASVLGSGTVVTVRLPSRQPEAAA
jgi:signal transduction histidine kinase